jgi:hypothetical protein
MQQERKVVKQFDKNGDGWLNAEERKAARQFLKEQGDSRRPGGFGGRRGGFGPGGEEQEPAKPGPKVKPEEAKSFEGAPVYAPDVFRTFFLEFENPDWEQELADFKSTDVEVPATLTVDGKVFKDVGVHYHGASSYMMVGEGRKRSLVLSLDLVHSDQQFGGYRKFLLLNSHGDPSFLRTVLSLEMARDYLPAPRANFARVVVNGESWGVFVNQQHFNKDFLRDSFGTTKGARWKVPGSPNGQGSLAYLGDAVSPYRRIYDIKSKDDPGAWKALIQLCKVLSETPADQLEKALPPLLDVEGALKFLAWENVVVNGDGYWTRSSDYSIYQDSAGKIHFIPYDANETFSAGGGPGGPGGPGGFGPAMFLAPAILEQADKNTDQAVSKEEFIDLAGAWFDKLDTEKTGKLDQEQVRDRMEKVLPPPGGRGGFGPPRDGPGRGRMGPGAVLAGGVFAAGDENKDGALTRDELKNTFTKWHAQWDADGVGALSEDKLAKGLNAALPRPNFGGRQGGGGRGPGFGGARPSAELDPLVDAEDQSKPLISKLLAVPAWRQRYLAIVREMAEKWLDWNRLGPLASKYQALIAEEVKADTRRLSSFEAFQRSVNGDGNGGGSGQTLKSFAETRRAYLLKKVPPPAQ